MKNSVIAIGLDSADPVLLEKWMSEGHLKNLARLRQQGAYGRLVNMEYYKGESAWTNFLTGCLPHKTGYWSKFDFNPKTYQTKTLGEHGAYDFNEYAPFYAVGDKYRVAVFDMPQTTISDRVNGIQALAWGAHAPMIDRASEPKGLLSELIEKYGDHPADTFHHNDRSDWYNPSSVAKLKRDLEVGLERRTAITKDLLSREQWDLFLTAIGETHTAQHYFWHLSQPDHPLYKQTASADRDPMLEYFEAVDESLGEMLAEAPENAYVIVFSAHGQGANSADLLSMVVLPEFLYRFSFPGKSLLKSQEMGMTPPPPLTPKNPKDSWYKLLHNLKNDPDPMATFLRSVEPKIPGRFRPYLTKFYKKWAKLTGSPQTELFSWHPSKWYQPYWPQMKAFYIPGFSDGYIRINLQGRESQGIVSPAEYNAVCDELIEQLHQLTDARTGKPIVKKVVRTRQKPTDNDPKLPDSDLVVVWEDFAVDVVDSPKYDRIGPIYFNRTGAHRPRGFWTIKGPGIEAGSTLAEGHAVDLAPTILELMDAPIPEYMDGKPLLSTKVFA
ncbi:alkaline phosphatase family protein [Argonema galeatum]|uniref:alkaline phosphatase family protein n=1 Tax=Argonema galeatum TaxID=2942762 RepID=UPI002013AA5B|nr:alkaline phosphatase family protein [Argonema galeatum A003/A1]